MIKLMNWAVRFSQLSFIKVARQTMMLLAPFAYVGALAIMLKKTLFTPEGFLFNITRLGDVMPERIWNGLAFFVDVTWEATFGMFGLMVAYSAARYTAKLYHKDAPLAGMTGLVTMLMMAAKYGRQNGQGLTFDWNLLNVRSILVALIVGYGVGQLYHWLGPTNQAPTSTIETIAQMQQRALDSFKPLFLSLAIGGFLGALFNWLTLHKWLATGYAWVENLGQNNESFWLAVPLIAFSLLLTWLGIGGPTIDNTVQGATNAVAANLTYALQHGSAWNVPYKFPASSLYSTFGNFGGDGMLLALVIAMMIASHRVETQRLARWNLLPVLFNSNYGMMMGLPVILNPLMLIPYVLLPIANLLLATGAIWLHLIPTPAYPLPMGTPGPLAAFIGTNGDWEIMLFSLFLLVFDILCYLPFVRLALGAENKIAQLEKAVA